MAIVVLNVVLLALDAAFVAVAARGGWRVRAVALVAYAVFAAAAAATAAVAGFERHVGFAAAQGCAWALFAHGPALGFAVALRDARAGRSAWGGAVGALALAAVATYAFRIEPRWLEVTVTEVPAPGLARPVRVAIVADLQTDEPGDFERRALLAVRDAKPELVLFTGDYVQLDTLNAYLRAQDQLNALLREVALDPPLGAYAVRGDVEPARVERWGAVFAGTRVVPIGVTSHVDDERLAAVGIELGALDRDDSRNAALALPPKQDGRFRLVFGHAPDNALGPHDADLVVAGHTHGGQVQVPLLGPLLTLSDVPRAVAGGGLHARPHGGFVYVSRGIGMERGAAPRLRFGARPEVALLDLVPTPPAP